MTVAFSLLSDGRASWIIAHCPPHLYRFWNHAMKFSKYGSNRFHSAPADLICLIYKYKTFYCAGKLILSTPDAARQAYEIIGIKRDINPNLFTAFCSPYGPFFKLFYHDCEIQVFIRILAHILPIDNNGSCIYKAVHLFAV